MWMLVPTDISSALVLVFLFQRSVLWLWKKHPEGKRYYFLSQIGGHVPADSGGRGRRLLQRLHCTQYRERRPASGYLAAYDIHYCPNAWRLEPFGHEWSLLMLITANICPGHITVYINVYKYTGGNILPPFLMYLKDVFRILGDLSADMEIENHVSISVCLITWK